MIACKNIIISILQNHPVERLWVEFNKRVNYPIKYILVRMEEEGILDMDLPVDRFCVSWFTLHIANIGVAQTVHAWNEHPIPGMWHISI